MFVDVSTPQWSVMHINEAVIEQTGLMHCSHLCFHPIRRLITPLQLCTRY